MNQAKPALEENRPDIIFYPHVKDWNTTHIGTHYLVVDGLKSMGPEFSTYCVERTFLFFIA